MLTDFGKLVRKLRIDTDETLSNMAKELKKSVPFLSAIETGKKKVPSKLLEAIKEFFNCKGVSPEDLEKLEKYAHIANNAISTEHSDKKKKEMIVKFAKSELTQSQLDYIMNILNME